MHCFDFNSNFHNCSQNRFFLRKAKQLGIFYSSIVFLAIKIFAQHDNFKSKRIRNEQYFRFLFTAISIRRYDIHKGLLEVLMSFT
jgi:hypothetical protein